MSYITFKSKLIEQKVKQYLKKKHADLLVKEGRKVLVKEEGAPLITKMLIHNDDLHSEDLADLQMFPNIKELQLLSDNITHLEALPPLEKLQKLYLNVKATDYTPLAKYKKLKKVEVYDSGVSDITPFCELSKLTVLKLSCNKLFSLIGIAKLQNLTELWLDRNQITDISPLLC